MPEARLQRTREATPELVDLNKRLFFRHDAFELVCRDLPTRAMGFKDVLPYYVPVLESRKL